MIATAEKPKRIYEKKYPTILGHRGYRMIQKNGAYICSYLFKHSNYFMPRRFLWGQIERVPELYEYIDALGGQRIRDIKELEDIGDVKDIEYEDVPTDVPIISITPQRLMAILRGEDTLSVPATAKLRFCDTTGHHYPAEFFAELAGDKSMELYIEKINQLVEEGRPILYFNGAVPRFNNERFKVVNSSIQLELAEKTLEDTRGYAERSTATEESVINETDHGSYVELISLLNAREEKPYYTRRLLDKDRNVVWSGTSYHMQGPWRVYAEDKTRLEALGAKP